MTNTCFGGKEGFMGDKWEREVKEDKDKDNFVHFLCGEGDKQKNEPEVQKGSSI